MVCCWHTGRYESMVFYSPAKTWHFYASSSFDCACSGAVNVFELFRFRGILLSMYVFFSGPLFLLGSFCVWWCVGAVWSAADVAKQNRCRPDVVVIQNKPVHRRHRWKYFCFFIMTSVFLKRKTCGIFRVLFSFCFLFFFPGRRKGLNTLCFANTHQHYSALMLFSPSSWDCLWSLAEKGHFHSLATQVLAKSW